MAANKAERGRGGWPSPPHPGVIGLRKGKEKSKESTFSKSGKSVPKDKVQLPFLTDQETSG